MLLELMSHKAVAVTEAGTTPDILKAEQLPIHYWCASGQCKKKPTKAASCPLNYEVLHLVWSCRTLYVSQFLKKLTDPSTLLWITVQPPGSCLWSHHTCISRLAFSGFTRYMPLPVWPSSSACRQSLNGPGQKENKKTFIAFEIQSVIAASQRLTKGNGDKARMRKIVFYTLP